VNDAYRNQVFIPNFLSEQNLVHRSKVIDSTKVLAFLLKTLQMLLTTTELVFLVINQGS